MLWSQLTPAALEEALVPMLAAVFRTLPWWLALWIILHLPQLLSAVLLFSAALLLLLWLSQSDE